MPCAITLWWWRLKEPCLHALFDTLPHEDLQPTLPLQPCYLQDFAAQVIRGEPWKLARAISACPPCAVTHTHTHPPSPNSHTHTTTRDIHTQLLRLKLGSVPREWPMEGEGVGDTD